MIPCGTLSEPAFKIFFFIVHLIPLAKGRKKHKLTKLYCKEINPAILKMKHSALSRIQLYVTEYKIKYN